MKEGIAADLILIDFVTILKSIGNKDDLKFGGDDVTPKATHRWPERIAGCLRRPSQLLNKLALCQSQPTLLVKVELEQ